MSNEPPAPLRPPEIPPTFRQELVPHIFKAILNGESCALVGVKGVGMSNLLRFLCQAPVVKRQLGDSSRVLLVYLESDPVLDMPGLYPALIRQIVKSAKRSNWPRAELAALNHLSSHLPAKPETLDAEEVLSEIIAYLCENRQCRIVVVFDEGDRTFSRLASASLRGLRRLRDDFKLQLSFLIGTRIELTHLARQRQPGDADVDKFTELFDSHTFPVRPYTHTDALSVTARKTFGWQQQLSIEQQDRLYRATGGHAKLLIAGLTLLRRHRHLPWPDVERRLWSDVLLAEVCDEIWNDLDPGERAALGALATGQRDTIQAGDLDQLRLKGMVIGRPDSIFSSVFEVFIRLRAGEVMAQAQQPGSWQRGPSRLREPGA